MSAPPPTGTGVLDLAWTAESGRAAFGRQRYRWPYVVHRLFRPDQRDPGRAVTVVQNAGAGLQPGDDLRATLAAHAGARVDVRGQGATYVAGVPGGATARERVTVRVDDRSAVAVDLGPRLLTPHARLVQESDLVVALGGVAAVVDSFVLHPQARRAGDVALTTTTRVTVQGAEEPLAVDRQDLDGLALVPDAFAAFATAVVAAPGHLPCPGCAALLGAAAETAHAYAAASELPARAGFVVRLAASDGLALRRGVFDVAAAVGRVVAHAAAAPAPPVIDRPKEHLHP